MGELSHEETALVPLLKGSRFLIADPTSSRKSCRALLSEFLVKPDQIDVVETANEAMELVKSKIYNVILADYSIGSQPCFELVRLQGDRTPPGTLRAFFLLTTQDSNSTVASAASENVDTIIVKPFSFGTLKQQFLEVLSQKLAPTPYIQAVDKGRGFIKAEKWSEALQAFAEARRLNPQPALACAYEGEIFQKQNDHTRAIRSFEEALTHNPTHFRSLLGSVDSYMAMNDYQKAYGVARRLAENHTIPAKRIPDMIRLSIMNQQFEDVVGFYQTSADLTQLDDNLAQHLGAGLVICGLQFLKKDNREAAIDAFRKAEVSSKQNPKILMRILQALVSAGMEAEMKSFMARVPEEVKNSPEVQTAEIEFNVKSGEKYRALEQSLRLIQQGVKLERLFEIAILLSVELKRKNSLIEDVVFKATTAFPEKKAYFESLLPATP